MKILLTGAKGQLGQCFIDRVPKQWDVKATDSSELDISHLESVEGVIKEYNPDVIVNAVAYTLVDKAEQEKDIAYKVNAIGPKNLATAAKKIGAHFFHVSTDYVFNGEATTPYLETDKTNPLGVYGQTKLEGEMAVLGDYPKKSIIIRTSWVYSEYGNNFVKTMIRLAKEKEVLNIVDDQIGCPTYAGDIANTIIALINSNISSGLYHFSGTTVMSWFDFAKMIIDTAYNLNVLKNKPVINPIKSSEYLTQAKRPYYSVLNCEKIKIQNIVHPDINKSLVQILNKLA